MKPIERNPLVVRREHPGDSKTIDYLLAKGDLIRLLPGVHRWSQVDETFHLRALAAHKWKPRGILSGSTAARLRWWPELADETVRMTCSTMRASPSWLETTRQQVPVHLTTETEGVRVANTELSILQMCAGGDGNPICEGLRRRVTTLDRLWEAMSQLPSGLVGKELMRQTLRESRDEPWSPLEREAHRRLRAARIRGWRSNHRVIVRGRTFYADIVFLAEKLIIEIDGRAYHSAKDLDDDIIRQNLLIAAGWKVLRFSLATMDRMVPEVRAILKKERSAWRRDRLAM